MQPRNRFNHRSIFHAFTVLPLVIFGITLGGCASTMNLPSHWNNHKIDVDGKNTDWDVTYLIDDNKLVIGFVNDSDFVYLMLATNDRGLAMSMMRGLTVWFDPKGGSDKTFGIRYPLDGMVGRGNRPVGEGGGEALQDLSQRFSMVPTELEILGPGKEDAHRMQILETGGIQARVNLTGNSLVYEMRVPYRESYPFSIKSNPSSNIGLGLETSEARTQRRGQVDGGEGGERGGIGGAEESGSGRGGMRGGGRGGRGGIGQGSSGAPEPLDIWMKVRLIANGGEQKPALQENH